jgi:hypothetical protein
MGLPPIPEGKLRGLMGGNFGAVLGLPQTT